MNEFDFATKNVQEYATKTDASSFDKVLPEEPIKLSTKHKRFPFLTKAGTTQYIQLKRKNKYHEVIFRGCIAGFESDWFSRLSDNSKPRYFESTRKFFDWINTSGYKTTDKTRYTVLKDYEAYQMNVLKLKNSNLGSITTTLNEGLSSLSLTKEEHNYLQILAPLSKPAQRPKAEAVSLTSWFDLPWLRAVIGEKVYLQLESPSRLLRSFRVTIASTLLWLLEQRSHWKQSSVLDFDPSYSCWYYDWNRLLLQDIGTFDSSGEPKNELSQLLLIDLVLPSAQAAVKEKLAATGTINLPRTITTQGKKIIPWQRPAFFHPDFQNQYSSTEELLCAYLVACEAVQPTDIPKLKVSNYAREHTPSGRLIAMECTYYKGRAGGTKQPDILMSSDIWTQAFDRYITSLSNQELFKTDVSIQSKFPKLKNTHNTMSLLFKIFSLSDFHIKLKVELKKADATPLFSHALLALEQDQENYTQFQKRTGKGAGEYKTQNSQPLPATIFTLTHIKSTAVHAKSDNYRDSDLINHNSHTALTEKTSYLTDTNKDWVNQAGRITRLVLHDLQNVVYQPSITAITQAVKDLELRTKVIKATKSTDATTHSLRNTPPEVNDDDTIIVTDTTETALTFIHYLTQAEKMLPKLLLVRPDWVERTLIVQVEWRASTLIRMQSTASAQEAYIKLEEHLPPLFNHLLESTE